jgi:hypothetical protein
MLVTKTDTPAGTAATDGQANTGGGGGGGGGSSDPNNGAGGKGGSGVVYVSFDTGATEAELFNWLQDLVGNGSPLDDNELATYLNRIETAWENANDASDWWTVQNVKSAILPG